MEAEGFQLSYLCFLPVDLVWYYHRGGQEKARRLYARRDAGDDAGYQVLESGSSQTAWANGSDRQKRRSSFAVWYEFQKVASMLRYPRQHCIAVA